MLIECKCSNGTVEQIVEEYNFGWLNSLDQQTDNRQHLKSEKRKE